MWAAADKLRGNMDAAEYKHVVLGLIFLKYISDRFEERRDPLRLPTPRRRRSSTSGLYIGDNVFWVPHRGAVGLHPGERQAEPTIGQLLDEAMVPLEAENPSLKGRTDQELRPARSSTRPGSVNSST